MEHLILVRPTEDGRFLAQSLFFAEVKAEGATEHAAVEQVRAGLIQLLAKTHLVRVEVPESPTGNPWLDACGVFADDPQYEMYQEELRKARALDETP
jgi:hypothetical protein